MDYTKIKNVAAVSIMQALGVAAAVWWATVAGKHGSVQLSSEQQAQLFAQQQQALVVDIVLYTTMFLVLLVIAGKAISDIHKRVNKQNTRKEA